MLKMSMWILVCFWHNHKGKQSLRLPGATTPKRQKFSPAEDMSLQAVLLLDASEHSRTELHLTVFAFLSANHSDRDGKPTWKRLSKFNISHLLMQCVYDMVASSALAQQLKACVYRTEACFSGQRGLKADVNDSFFRHKVGEFINKVAMAQY